MTRDPIFSFNPDLPNVSLDRAAEFTLWSDDDCGPLRIMRYTMAVNCTYDCNEDDCDPFFGTIGPVPGPPPLKNAEILEETGLPRVFNPAQAAEVGPASTRR